MGLSRDIREVLALQNHYSSSNTAEMRRRGEIARRSITKALKPATDVFAQAMRVSFNDVLIEGRDGTGLKSEVPWVRFSSREYSPRATNGWYVVILPRRDGVGVYLALAHGSATFSDGSLVARDDEQLAILIAWARGVLSSKLRDHPHLTLQVELGAIGPLAASYEKSCAAAIFYRADSIPNDDDFVRDLSALASLLGDLYEADRLGKMPLSLNPDIREIEAISAQISRPASFRQGQGFLVSPKERRAIEKRAMIAATDYLRDQGFGTKDVSAKESFDILAMKDREPYKVEVKGTTGAIGKILLTSNEVDLHRRNHPANALIVVYEIELYEKEGVPVARGGTVKAWLPWRIDASRLRGITYSYELTQETTQEATLAK